MRIRLLRTHIVDGKTYPPGRVINIPDSAARWCIEQGVGVLADAPAPDAPQPISPEATDAGEPANQPEPES